MIMATSIPGHLDLCLSIHAMIRTQPNIDFEKLHNARRAAFVKLHEIDWHSVSVAAP
jgi:hypothetical protein